MFIFRFSLLFFIVHKLFLSHPTTFSLSTNTDLTLPPLLISKKIIKSSKSKNSDFTKSLKSTSILRKTEDANKSYALIETSIGDSTEKMVLKARRNIGK